MLRRKITGRFWQEMFGSSRKHPQRPLSLLLLPRYPELILRLAVVQIRDMTYARPIPLLIAHRLERLTLQRASPPPAVVSISLAVYSKYNKTYPSIVDWGDLTSQIFSLTHPSSIPPERSITQPAYDVTINLPAEFLTLPSKDLATGVPILLKVDSAGHTSRDSCTPLYTNQTHSIRSATQSYTSYGSLVTPTMAGSGTVQFSGHACTHSPSVLVVQLCLICTISLLLRGV